MTAAERADAEAQTRGAQAEDEGPSLSENEFDSMFAEPKSLESFFRAEDFEEPEDLPEPEPISQVFPVHESMHEESGLGRPWVIALITVLVIGSIVGGLIVDREQVVAKWPRANSVYALVGFGVSALGAGLDFRGTKTEWEKVDGANVVVVRGSIVNLTDVPLTVPMILVSLRDSRSEMLQEAIIAPLKPELVAGETIGFKAIFEKPSALARRAGVEWTQPMAEPGG